MSNDIPYKKPQNYEALYLVEWIEINIHDRNLIKIWFSFNMNGLYVTTGRVLTQSDIYFQQPWWPVKIKVCQNLVSC